MSYGHIYVARVAVGAKDAHTVRVFQEAESYDGPSLIIAYSPCIAHGYDMANSLDQQKAAINSGYWPLYRYDPRRAAAGENPLKLDSSAPKLSVAEFASHENRFRMVEQRNPEQYHLLMAQAQADVARRYALYEHMAKASTPKPGGEG